MERRHWIAVAETASAFAVAFVFLYGLGFIFPSISFSEMRRVGTERAAKAQRFAEWERSQNRVAERIEIAEGKR